MKANTSQVPDIFAYAQRETKSTNIEIKESQVVGRRLALEGLEEGDERRRWRTDVERQCDIVREIGLALQECPDLLTVFPKVNQCLVRHEAPMMDRSLPEHSEAEMHELVNPDSGIRRGSADNE